MRPFVSRTIVKVLSLCLLLGISSIKVLGQDYDSAIEKARFLISEHQKQTNIPGIQVAVMVDGELIWSEGLGYSDLLEQSIVTAKSVFRVASISKSITSLVLGKLIEEGKLSPNDDVRNYVPEFPESVVPITVAHLATSTSGIRHYNSSDPKYNSEHFDSVIQSLDRFKNDKLLFTPGSDFMYSSYGWVLLSAVMERASGIPFKTLMESEWEKLGMHHTYFDDLDLKLSEKSTHYTLGKRGSREVAPFEDRSFMWAGGGYLSTAENLANMAHQFVSDSYLSIEIRKMMTSSNILPNGQNPHYGWGWETGRSRMDTPIFSHSGSMSSARSHLLVYPEENVIFSYISNTGDHVFFNDREAQIIAELFILAKRGIAATDDSITGTWEIETKSLRDRRSKGDLILSKTEHGMQSGNIRFKRSRKQENYPILEMDSHNSKVHLVAVTPMFIDFYLDVSDNSFRGEWLHDFNVFGTPETDDYWKPRKIVGEKVIKN